MSFEEWVGNVLEMVTYADTAVVAFPVDFAGNRTRLIQITTHKFKEASIDAIQELLTAVLERFQELDLLRSPGLLLTTVDQPVRAVINALITRVEGLSIIENAIASNDINKATLALIWRDSAKLGKFLVGLLGPIKCYALANSGTGIAVPGEEHGLHNELDLTDPMNRHAIICRVQRFVRSVVFIFSHMTQHTIQTIDITEQMTLLSDNQIPNIISEPLSLTSSGTITPKEKWIFVNSIARELY